jgi:hypothetical protein
VLIAELKIPQMFTAYAEDLKYLDNGLHHFQYFCEECDQVFSSAWGKIPGSMSHFERGNYFSCPYCRKLHEKNVVYIGRGEAAPNKIRLSVKEYKEVVTFEVFSYTVVFRDYLRLYGGSRKEIFRFDIAKQTVTFNDGSETIELGNPFKLDVFEKSILRFFKSNSLANSNQRSELYQILKVLRETVHNKLEKRLKHRVSSMFVSQGQYNGTFLLPIFNMAYRVSCPDAPNLPNVYRFEEGSIRDFWRDKMLDNFDYIDSVMSQTRRKKGFFTALAAVHSLPDKRVVRRLLIENPFGVKMLAESFALCKNYDNSINLYQALVLLNSQSFAVGWLGGLFSFLRRMKPLYGEAGVIRLVTEARELQTVDCIRLYQQLSPENKKALKTEGVRLRDLHDWMSLNHKRQTHVNKKFDVPEHIVRRLSMQSNRLKFFLPQESMELLEAGHTLHNCVASYGMHMVDNKLWIVLVADDKGGLAACLEIKQNELIQAKLDRNMPVSSNAEINNAILAWSTEAGIKINTSDIKKPIKKKVSIPA